MFIKESILIALEGIAANKIRALLTMLGIIIGIGSVIAIVTVGDAMAGSVAATMSRLGATNILVGLQNKHASDTGFTVLGGSITEDDLITDEMIEKYAERFIDRYDAISVSKSSGVGQARNGRSYANITLMGVNDGYAIANDIKILEGRFIKDSDLKSKRYVAVVSDKLVNNLFPSMRDCLGKEIKADMTGSVQTFTIIGVYKYQTNLTALTVAESEKDLRTYLYAPVSTVNMSSSMDRGYIALTVSARNDIDITKFVKDTTDFFNIYYEKNPKYEIAAVSMDAMLSIVGDVMGILNIAIAVIGGISLIVGGIGIMNIMLVSVTERTREIGMRKAIGARNLSIQIQFIIEAAAISGIGGAIGVVLGLAIGLLGSSLLNNLKLPSLASIVISVLFSMLIGVFFGYYPANKAANLDPVEALRYE